MRLLCVAILILSAITVAKAQTNAASSTATAQPQTTLTEDLKKDDKSTFSGSTSFAYNSNLRETNDYERESSLSADLTLNYAVSGENILTTYIDSYQETTQGREAKLNDGFVGWMNNGLWYKGDRVTFGQQVRLNLPYSKESRVRDTKIVGVSVIPVVQVKLTPTLLFIYQPQFIKNFHTYKRAPHTGKANTEYAVSNIVAIAWQVTDQLYLQGKGRYSNVRTYNGTYRNPSFETGVETGYNFTEALSFGVGWTNAGPIRRFERGSDQTIELFDNETSTVYAALSLVF